MKLVFSDGFNYEYNAGNANERALARATKNKWAQVASDTGRPENTGVELRKAGNNHFLRLGQGHRDVRWCVAAATKATDGDHKVSAEFFCQDKKNGLGGSGSFGVFSHYKSPRANLSARVLLTVQRPKRKGDPQTANIELFMMGRKRIAANVPLDELRSARGRITLTIRNNAAVLWCKWGKHSGTHRVTLKGNAATSTGFAGIVGGPLVSASSCMVDFDNFKVERFEQATSRATKTGKAAATKAVANSPSGPNNGQAARASSKPAARLVLE